MLSRCTLAAYTVKESARKRELSERAAARGFNKAARGVRRTHLSDAAAAPYVLIWPDRLESFSGH
jgi:hypothetical protein